MQPLHVSDTNTHSIMSRTGKVQRFMVYSVPSFPVLTTANKETI